MLASVCSGPLSTLCAVSRRNYVRNRSLAFTCVLLEHGLKSGKNILQLKPTHETCKIQPSSCWGYWMPSMTNWWSWHGWMLELWGAMCIFDAGAPAFRLWWASNPGAITHLLTCWIEHNNSLDPRANDSSRSFTELDWVHCVSSKCLLQKSFDWKLRAPPGCAKKVSIILHRFPEIRSLASQQVPRHTCWRATQASPELRHEKVPETLTWQCFSLFSSALSAVILKDAILAQSIYSKAPKFAQL